MMIREVPFLSTQCRTPPHHRHSSSHTPTECKLDQTSFMPWQHPDNPLPTSLPTDVSKIFCFRKAHLGLTLEVLEPI
jgi:hypothetical protein